MKTPLLLAAALLALCPPAARADIVYFGNFAPGTELPTTSNGNAIDSGNWMAVTFTTGSEAIQITSLDLGIWAGGSTGGFRVLLSDMDFDTALSVTPLLTFSTIQTIPTTIASDTRITFTPDGSATLAPNTAYYLRLEWDNSNAYVRWVSALDDPAVNSTYSSYGFAYGTYSSYPGADMGAYYITAVTAVPEAGASALAIAGLAVLAGLTHRAKRRQRKAD